MTGRCSRSSTEAGSRRHRLRTVVPLITVVVLTGCSAPAVTPTEGDDRPARTAAPGPSFRSTGDGSELVADLPVLRTASPGAKRVVLSQEVDVREAQVLMVAAEFQTTNDTGSNVYVGSQVVLAESPSAVAGAAVTPANGENVTPDMHHGQQTRSGLYETSSADRGRRYLNLVVWAASSQARPGERLRVDEGYGRLSVAGW